MKYIVLCVCVLVTQSCETLCDPINCSPPGSSVHGILQARILEWVAISFSKGSFRPRDRTQGSSSLQASSASLVFPALAGGLFTTAALTVSFIVLHDFYILFLPMWLRGKESACHCRRCRFDPWVGEICWRRKWQSTPVSLPGKSHGPRSLAGYSP